MERRLGDGIDFDPAIACVFRIFPVSTNEGESQELVCLVRTQILSKRHRSPGAFADVWWKDTWNVEQEELLRCVGLDSYMFLRFLRLGARMAGVGTLCSLVLLPIYATGNAEGESTMEFNSLTLARVEAGSNRMWATVTAWCIFVAFILHEFWSEWLVRCES